MINWCVVAVFLCALLAIASLNMSGTANGDRSVVQMRCRVSSSTPQVKFEFEKEFCRALVHNLSEDLGTTFELTEDSNWKSEGRVLEIEIHVRSTDKASVTTTTGQIEEGIYKPNFTKSTSLSTVDGPLSSSSSRALVRVIGLQMGLIR